MICCGVTSNAMVRRGLLWRVAVWLAWARFGRARHEHGVAGASQGRAWPGPAGSGMAEVWYGLVGLGSACTGTAWPGAPWRGAARASSTPLLRRQRERDSY